jgi:hypothetical protein
MAKKIVFEDPGVMKRLHELREQWPGVESGAQCEALVADVLELKPGWDREQALEWLAAD